MFLGKVVVAVVIVIILWLVDLAELIKYDGLLQMSDYKCPIIANCPTTLSDYSCTEWFVKNKAANAPIKFEELWLWMQYCAFGYFVL